METIFKETRSNATKVYLPENFTPTVEFSAKLDKLLDQARKILNKEIYQIKFTPNFKKEGDLFGFCLSGDIREHD